MDVNKIFWTSLDVFGHFADCRAAMHAILVDDSHEPVGCCRRGHSLRFHSSSWGLCLKADGLRVCHKNMWICQYVSRYNKTIQNVKTRYAKWSLTWFDHVWPFDAINALHSIQKQPCCSYMLKMHPQWQQGRSICHTTLRRPFEKLKWNSRTRSWRAMDHIVEYYGRMGSLSYQFHNFIDFKKTHSLIDDALIFDLHWFLLPSSCRHQHPVQMGRTRTSKLRAWNKKPRQSPSRPSLPGRVELESEWWSSSECRS